MVQRKSVVAFALFSILLGAQSAYAQTGAPEGASGVTAKQATQANRYMVAAANPIATETGRAILRMGGNAVDAAIATQLVLNLVEPQSSGIGGGLFLVFYDKKSGKILTYDGRETAPAAAKPDRFLGADGKPLKFMEAVIGGRSVGVPGTLRVLEMAHKAHGRLAWAKLFDPAIRMAEEGFPMPQRLHTLLKAEKTLLDNPVTRDYFFGPDGQPKPVGSIIVNKPFAEVLRTVARGGADAFYQGPIARDIVATVQAAKGDLTEEDMARYRPVARPAVCGPYRQYKVCGMGPPSSGGITVLQILTMLEPYDLSKLDPGSATVAHLFAEAGKLAYADRGRYIADSDFIKVPVGGLLDRGYLRERGNLIHPAQAMTKAEAGNPPMRLSALWGMDQSPELPSTSHVSVIDAVGNALSMTTTIENGFGSQLMVRGFLLNNELTDFSFLPEENGQPIANRLEANKRPRSSMAPTILFDRQGRVKLVVGSPGGSAIINYVAKTIIGIIDWKLDPQAAVDLPNLGNRGGATELEAGRNLEGMKAALEATGHQVRLVTLTSGIQAIVVHTQSGKEPRYVGGADSRREGVALGD